MAMTEAKLRRRFPELFPPKRRKATPAEIEKFKASFDEMLEKAELRKAAERENKAHPRARIERLEKLMAAKTGVTNVD